MPVLDLPPAPPTIRECAGYPVAPAAPIHDSTHLWDNNIKISSSRSIGSC